MKASGLSAVECGKRLLAMARDAGGDGIVMECVDYNNYPKELREAIRTFGKETAAAGQAAASCESRKAPGAISTEGGKP